MVTTLIDHSGETFGRLKVIERAQNTSSGAVRWLCRCVCGNLCTPTGGNLRAGNSTSCGCYNQEISTTHGLSFSRKLYDVWKGIVYGEYPCCDEWKNDPIAFCDEMGPCPPGHRLVRIDSGRWYESGNCEWGL